MEIAHSRSIRLGAIFCFIAVAAGAFGAHALKKVLSPDQLDIWNKAVFYQFVHAMGLLFAGCSALKSSLVIKTTWLFSAGIICFSGSLYILSAREHLGFNVAWLGPITPFGGLCFLAGWLLVFFSITSKD